MNGMTRHYIAIIADMVRSRDLPSARRAILQRRFVRLTDRLNHDYRRLVAAKFVVTLGDEFQGLLNSAAVIPDLVWHFEQYFAERDLRLGIGFGTLTTPLQKIAINIDGPALHAARFAVDAARRSKALGGVFRGFGQLDETLDGLARVLWFHRSRWTLSQRKIANLLRQGLSQTQAARKLRVTPQVISKQLLAAGWVQYAAGENAWRMILQSQVDPLLRSKHGRG